MFIRKTISLKKSWLKILILDYLVEFSMFKRKTMSSIKKCFKAILYLLLKATICFLDLFSYLAPFN